MGELKEVGGALPEEYIDTGCRGKLLIYYGDGGLYTPLSSQSLAPLLECTELFDDTELRLTKLPPPYSLGSFFTIILLCLGLTPPFPAAATVPLDAFLALFPALSSSNLNGLGRRCVRSYKPHLLHTILPGFKVERRHEGGSVVWQLKHLRRRYCVSLDAASSVCCTGKPVWGER